MLQLLELYLDLHICCIDLLFVVQKSLCMIRASLVCCTFKLRLLSAILLCTDWFIANMTQSILNNLFISAVCLLCRGARANRQHGGAKECSINLQLQLTAHDFLMPVPPRL